MGCFPMIQSDNESKALSQVFGNKALNVAAFVAIKTGKFTKLFLK